VFSIPFKGLFTPGSITFLLFMLVPGVLLLFRKKDGGRLGKLWIAALLVFYWIISTPIAALSLLDAIAPDVPPISSKADAHGATAIVVLSAGMQVARSHGDMVSAPSPEGWLRVMEAARLYRVLGGVPIIATGGLGSRQYSEAGLMAHQLAELGVPADSIIKEERARNTRDHALLVQPILKERGIARFVLVTSRPHLRRSVAAFRAVGADPVPAAPEVFTNDASSLQMYLPSKGALELSERVLYDLAGWIYYRARGWV
jgi:uncharacterized SAM-binding protein YcdF (DUF218 family)